MILWPLAKRLARRAPVDLCAPARVTSCLLQCVSDRGRLSPAFTKTTLVEGGLMKWPFVRMRLAGVVSTCVIVAFGGVAQASWLSPAKRRRKWWTLASIHRWSPRRTDVPSVGPSSCLRSAVVLLGTVLLAGCANPPGP